MAIAPTPLFHSTNTIVRTAARHVIPALLAFDAANPLRAMPPEAEGGRVKGPPQRDKLENFRFNLGASLQEQDQLRVLAMLNAISDRFAFSMEDMEPANFRGEPMRLELTSDKPLFCSPHKLGLVELDFVEA